LLLKGLLLVCPRSTGFCSENKANLDCHASVNDFPVNQILIGQIVTLHLSISAERWLLAFPAVDW
jgi:hypothetical protein